MKTNHLNRRVLFFFYMLLVAVSFNSALADEPASDEPADKSKVWNIEQPSGELTDQTIDVTEGTWISLDVSPDGQQIVFDLLGDLYLMPVEVTDQPAEPRKLTSGMAWDMQPRFSPDGQWIAFTSDRTGSSDKAGDNIWIIRSDGSQVRQVTNETYRLLNNPAWSPDGQYIVARKHFTSRRSLGAGEIWMYHRAAADAKAMTGLQLTSRPTDQKDVNEPIFSPDGRYVYFSQDDTSGSTFEYDKDSNQEIYVVKRYDRTTGEIENYITGPGGACRPTPSPDGKQIGFVRRIGANSVLHVMDCDSGVIRPVYGPLERDMQEAWAIHGVYPGFAWMPDGQSIVIYAKGKIRRIDVDSGKGHDIPFHIRDIRKVASAVRFPIEVAPDECHTKMLRWVQTSPDGSKVVFQSLGYIYVRDLATGEVQRLTAQTDHFEFFPQFSRDGKYIVYTTWNDKNLGSVRIASASAGGDQQSWKVTDSPGHYIEPTFSPDGQHVAFVKARGGYITSPLYARETGLYVASVKGDAIKKLVSGASSPQFADVSDRIYFERSNSNKDADNLGLYSIGIDGREERQHYESTWATNFRLSPDGQWIAFIERFHVYVAPFIQTGRTVQVGPGSSALPVAKVSEEAGDWIHFSGDSRTIHWALGSEFYSLPLTDAFAFLSENSISEHPDESESAAAKKPVSQEIGFSFAHAKSDTTIALVGGKIVTMGSAGTIESGTIVVQGNRILQVGPQQDITIPEGAQVIPTPGLVILPGLIDVHAHGPHSSAGITPQANWVNYARLAFGVTTVHDPSNDTHSIFAASEMAKAGVITAPRTFSTGTILYGATGSFKAEIESLEDAKFHLKRMKAVGAFSVKSYNQPRRDQRQQVLAAARELQMMVVPEGGSTFMHNMTMIVDGHTGIEHTLPVQTAYDDVMDLWRNTNVGYTPTLCVAYGGLSGERYWYEVDDLWLHARLNRFLPPHVLHPKSRRRQKAPLEDYNHIKVAEIAKQVVRDGGLAQAGGHGQLSGICTHWELWSFVQGGMTPIESLQCGTLFGAKYLGLDKDLGSLEVGKLADLVVISRGFDPTKEIRHSQEIAMVMANGVLFDATTMQQLSGEQTPSPEFYFHDPAQSISTPLPSYPGCDCHRPGGPMSWLNP